MILAGDEVLRSQQGNNNCYCQNNELSWFDWDLVETNGDMFAFTSKMIRFRKRHPCLTRRHFLTGQPAPKPSAMPDISWHGIQPGEPQWHDPSSRVLACTLGRTETDEEDLHIIFNMSDDTLQMALPKVQGRNWHLAVDTSAASGKDIIQTAQQIPIGQTIPVESRSIVVCESR
jgi:glycogen operon protein